MTTNREREKKGRQNTLTITKIEQLGCPTSEYALRHARSCQVYTTDHKKDQICFIRSNQNHQFNSKMECLNTSPLRIMKQQFNSLHNYHICLFWLSKGCTCRNMLFETLKRTQVKSSGFCMTSNGCGSPPPHVLLMSYLWVSEIGCQVLGGGFYWCQGSPTSTFFSPKKKIKQETRNKKRNKRNKVQKLVNSSNLD